MLQRKPSLVNRAFWNFLGASILTTVAAQLAVSTDAAIVSHLMGPHAMAAVNMAMPVLTTFLSLNSLLGVGASLLAAKAIGRRDSEEAHGANFIVGAHDARAVCSLRHSIRCWRWAWW